MLISNHLGFFTENPSIDVQHPRLGSYFYDATFPYDRDLQAFAKKCAAKIDLRLAEGVYAMMRGPSYETAAEVKALKILGADAVGMSTVPEALAARQLGMKVIGFSNISNMAAGIGKDTINHQEVMELGKIAGKGLERLVVEMFKKGIVS